MGASIASSRTDKLLSQVLLAYTNPDLIADRVLPLIGGLKDDTGDIPSLGNSHLRRYVTKRALYDEGQHRVSFSYSHDDKYRIDYFDAEAYVPDKLINQAENPFNPRRDGAFVAMEVIKLEREIALAELMTSTSILTNNTTLSGTSQFNDYANSDPNTIFENARTTVQNKIGREPNKMLMNRKVFNTLKSHPFYVERVKGVMVLSGPQLIEILKDLYEVDEVVVGKGIYINSKEGQTETKTKIWNNDVVFYYVPREASLQTPSFGYHLETSSMPLRGTSRREPNANKGELEGAEWAYQDLILDADCAYLVKDAVA